MRVFVLGLLLLCNYSFAYDGWSGDLKIKSVRVYSSNQVLITVPGADNPGNCKDTTYLVLMDLDSEAGKRKYSAVLVAYTAGKTVQLALTGCTGGGWPIVEQVWLK